MLALTGSSIQTGPIAKKTRLLVVTQGMPHPSNGACVVVFFHYIRALVDFGFEVHSLVLGSTDALSDSTDYETAFSGQPEFHLSKFPCRDILQPGRFGVRVLVEREAELQALIKNIAPDALLAFDLSAATAVATTDIPCKVVWLGDLLFQSNWYNYLYGFRENWMTLRWLPYAFAQVFRWKALYRRTLSRFDAIVVSSYSSVGVLSGLGLQVHFLPYPWPNSGALDRQCLRRQPVKPTFLFFGNLVGLGSRSSLHFLLDRVYPRLIKLWGNKGFTIYVGGAAKLRGWAAAKMAARPEFVFEGFISNLLERMADCHAVIAPLDVPVGNRSRILTAMAKRARIISHANAALGNPSLVDGETALLAKTPDEFAERMRFAVDEPQRCATIIDNAEKVHLEQYAPKQAVAKLIAVIERAMLQTSADLALDNGRKSLF